MASIAQCAEKCLGCAHVPTESAAVVKASCSACELVHSVCEAALPSSAKDSAEDLVDSRFDCECWIPVG